MAIGNISGLKTSAASSAKEVQDFVASLKGKSAADAMGTVARSHLLQALVISFVLQAVIVLAFTVPFALFPKPVEAQAPAPTTPPIRSITPTTAAAPATTAASATAPSTVPTTQERINKVVPTDMVKPEDNKTPDIEDLMKNMR